MHGGFEGRTLSYSWLACLHPDYMSMLFFLRPLGRFGWLLWSRGGCVGGVGVGVGSRGRLRASFLRPRLWSGWLPRSLVRFVGFSLAFNDGTTLQRGENAGGKVSTCGSSYLQWTARSLQFPVD